MKTKTLPIVMILIALVFGALGYYLFMNIIHSKYDVIIGFKVNRSFPLFKLDISV